jgi:hypothetical protein
MRTREHWGQPVAVARDAIRRAQLPQIERQVTGAGEAAEKVGLWRHGIGDVRDSAKGRVAAAPPSETRRLYRAAFDRRFPVPAGAGHSQSSGTAARMATGKRDSSAAGGIPGDAEARGHMPRQPGLEAHICSSACRESFASEAAEVCDSTRGWDWPGSTLSSTQALRRRGNC